MSEQQPINAGLLLISTRKYKQFVQPLVHQIDENFLPGVDKTIFVFTDEYQPELESHSRVIQILIPAYKWPYPTLFRYKIFHDNEAELKRCSHLYYLDVDMAVVGEVGPEVLVEEGLIIVRHPGFFVNDGWGNGDNENPKESTSYMIPEIRTHYYCGGTQGGTANAYLELSKVLAANIDEDEVNGIMAIYHDETHYNKYINENLGKIEMKELTPSMCMVEQPHLRQAWGISDLPVQIIALAKDHKSIRE